MAFFTDDDAKVLNEQFNFSQDLVRLCRTQNYAPETLQWYTAGELVSKLEVTLDFAKQAIAKSKELYPSTSSTVNEFYERWQFNKKQ